LAEHELEILRDALREHVKALTVDIGPRTPSNPDSLVRAANYIHSVFEDAGLTVSEQDYDYYDQRVTNLLGTGSSDRGGFCLLRCRRSLRHHPGDARRRRQRQCGRRPARASRTPAASQTEGTCSLCGFHT
jgi:hypothetical protein